MDALTREPVIAPPRGRTRRWVLTLLAVLAAVGVGAVIWYWPAAAPEQKAGGRFRDNGAVIPVLEAAAVKRDVPIWLEGLGTVQAFQTVTVRSMVDGPLVSVAFKEGQDVRAGDMLAQIDPRIYQASLDSAVAKKALDEANLANARLDLARYQKLVLTNYASQQQADTAKAQVAALEAQVRQDQAQIDNARAQLGYTTVTSPLDGRVGMRLVDPGNIVRSGDSTGLALITQLQPISVVFSLPQQNLPAVAAAMAADKAPAPGSTGGTPVPDKPDGGKPGEGATVLAFAQGTGVGGGKPLDRGSLTVLDNQIDPTTGTIKLKATFPNKTGTLWPGGFVGVRLRVDTVRDATVIPQSAVQRGPRQSFVYIVNEDSTVHRQNVTIGYEDEQGAVVSTGVNPGDRVVVDGASRLSDGAKISLAKPDAEAVPRGSNRPSAPGTRRRDRAGQGG